MQISETRPTCRSLSLCAVSALTPSTRWRVACFCETAQTLLFISLCPALLGLFQAYALIYMLNLFHVVSTATDLLCAILADAYFVRVTLHGGTVHMSLT
jgi:hypothetical protein